MVGKIQSRRRFCIGLGTSSISALSFSNTSVSFANTEQVSYQKNEMIGSMSHTIAKQKDTLLDIARKNGLGYVELLAANPGIDPWIPGEGAKIILPTAHILPSGPRSGLLLNIIDQRLYYFPESGGKIISYPIGTGQDAWDTPQGTTTIVRKVKNPTWYVPKSIREEQPELPAVFRPGPDNPLGTRALYLGWPAYLIHGTNIPWGVGRRVSHGCIRMYPESIKQLFPRVEIGTSVSIVSQEFKIAWVNRQLMVEVHPNLSQNIEIEKGISPTPAPIPEISYRVFKAAGSNAKKINWNTLKGAIKERSGIPISVLNSQRENQK
jgi:L,D-transpeptidase ErfK/SrfK